MADYNNYGSAGTAQSNVARPETSLESVVSRLTTIRGRVSSLGDRVIGAANMVVGFPGEIANAKDTPAAIPTSITDYLREIETALDRAEYGIGRLT